MNEFINQRDADGKRHGYWKCRLDDGHIWRSGYYNHGKRYGYWEFYNLNGDKKILLFIL